MTLTKSIHSNAHRVLVENLVAARKAIGLTQMDVALELKRPQSFVAKYELHERRLDLIEIVHLSRILQIDPAALVKTVEAAIDR